MDPPHDDTNEFDTEDLDADEGYVEWIDPDEEVAEARRALAAALVRRASSRMNHRATTDDIEEALHQDPECAPAYALRSVVTIFDEDALEDATRALELDPTNAGYYLERAGLLSRLGDHERALADCQRSLHLSDDRARAFLRRARVLAKMKRWQEAYDDFTRVIALEQGWRGGVLRERLELVHAMGDERALRAEVDRVLAIEPDHPAAIWRRAMLAMHDGTLEQALRDTTFLVEHPFARERPSPYDLYARAVVHLRMGHPLDAARDLDAALDQDATNGYFLSRRAQCAQLAGDLDEAIAYWDRAITSNAWCADFRIWRARALEARGGTEDRRRAIADVREAVTLEPKAGSHRGELARMHARAGRIALALREIERALALREIERALALFSKHRGDAQRTVTRHALLAQLEQTGLDLGHTPRVTARELRALARALARSNPPRRTSRRGAVRSKP